jgi:hypothetical protein
MGQKSVVFISCDDLMFLFRLTLQIRAVTTHTGTSRVDTLGLHVCHNSDKPLFP